MIEVKLVVYIGSTCQPRGPAVCPEKCNEIGNDCRKS